MDLEEIINDPTFTKVIKVIDKLGPLMPLPISILPAEVELLKYKAARETLDLVLDFVPIAGTVKSVEELCNGRNFITGEEVNRWVSAGGIILGLIPFGKVVIKGKKAMKLAQDIAKMDHQAKSEGELLQKIAKIVPEEDRKLIEGFRLGIVRAEGSSQITFTHWTFHSVEEAKTKFLSYLSLRQIEKFHLPTEDVGSVFKYLSFVIKHEETQLLKLDDKGLVGFANTEKKALVVHAPKAKETSWGYHKDILKEAYEAYEKRETQIDITKLLLKPQDANAPGLQPNVKNSNKTLIEKQ